MNSKTFTLPASLALLNLAFLMAVGALVAMPLGAGAIPAGVAAAATSAIVAGLLVCLLTKVPFEVTTPASSVAVIYAALALKLATQQGATFGSVWASLSLAVVLMGVLLLLAARFRFADAVRFLPAPVTAGFLTGIGLLVIWSQVAPLLGIVGMFDALSPGVWMPAVKPGAVLVGAAAAAVVYAFGRYKWPGPANVIALLVAAAVHHLTVLAAPALVGPTLGSIDSAATQAATIAAVSRSPLPDVLGTLSTVLPYAAFLALQSVMNAAVISPAGAALVGQRVDVHRTVRAQGLANIACGLLGALPVCTHTVISMAAARQKSHWQDVAVACVLLFVIVFLVGGLLVYLPVAALAGTLVMSGVGMVDKWARSLARNAIATRGRDRDVMLNLGIVTAVAASFMVGSVPLALLVGSVLAMVLLTVNLSLATRLSSQDATHRASTRAWAPNQAAWLAGQRAKITIVRPRGGLFFGTAEQLSRALSAVPATQAYCIVDMAKLTTLDATGCQLLAAGTRILAQQGTRTLLAGVDPHGPDGQGMVALGLDHPPADQWMADVDHALERAEQDLLERQGPSLDDASVPTPLTRDLQPDEVQTLMSVLTRREAPAGWLFRKGEPATSMYLVGGGRVEIHVHNAEAGRTTRLASFGPGSIFGEVSLISSGVRTADAWCVEPTVLHELTRAALDALEAGHPKLHAQVLRNLGIHLANRLVVATSTVEAQQ